LDGAEKDIELADCEGTTTLGAPFHVFFDDPGTGINFFDGDNRPLANDNYLNPDGTTNEIGLDLTIWDTTDPQGGPIGNPSITDPARAYKVTGHSVSWNQNTTSFRMFWRAAKVWHYQNQPPFNFVHWLGLLGGTAFLFRLIHDIIMAVSKIFFCAEGQQGYTEVKG
jgi:hypothetical protein